MKSYIILNYIIHKLFLSLIFISSTIKIKTFLIFPLEYIPRNNYKFLKNHNNKMKLSSEEIIREIFYKNLITKIEIGTPSQKIPLFITINDDKFQFINNNISKISEDSLILL